MTDTLQTARLLSVIEAAEYLGTSRSSLLADEKRIEGHPQSFRHAGRKTTVFDRVELDGWIERLKRDSRGTTAVHQIIVRTREPSSKTTPHGAFAGLKKGLPKGATLTPLPSMYLEASHDCASGLRPAYHLCGISWPDVPGKVPALSVVMQAAETDAFVVVLVISSAHKADPDGI